jgi:hypothetical protein
MTFCVVHAGYCLYPIFFWLGIDHRVDTDGQVEGTCCVCVHCTYGMYFAHVVVVVAADGADGI